MELTHHLVQPGATLSDIAQQHGTSVDQLCQLNPFIRDPDRIQVGWNLSVPVQPGATATPQADTPAQTAQPSAEAAGNQCVLQLDPPTTAAPSSVAAFAEKAAHPCDTRYANIIYATDEQAFWLLPERVASVLKEAEYKLGQQVLPSKSPDERKKGLDASELLEYFMEPILANFLAGDEQARMLQIEAQEPYIEQRYLNKRAYALMDPRMRATPLWQEYQRLEALYREWRPLRDSALKEAKTQGYTYEQDRLFTPEAMEARKRVQHYLEARKKLFELGELQIFSQGQIAALLAEKQTRYEQAIDCSVNCRAQFGSYLRWLENNQQGLQFKEYLDAIIAVAEYGLALPEYALVGNGQQGGVEGGIAAFKQYLALEQKQLAVNQRLQDKYQAWIEASGENTPAPSGLVDAERLEWDSLQVERAKLQAIAERNVAAARPRRHLLWQPEEFTPRPVERLVKTHFPLREVSFADRKSVLSHFSLKDMREAFKTDAAKMLGDAPSKLRHSVSGSSNSVATGARNEFQEWLISQGAKQLKDQAGNWFDAEGWFDVELFHQYLQGQRLQVSTLEDTAARAEWGERLRQMLFKGEVRTALRLFDKSPQAQLIRCLTPPQSSIHTAASMATPNFTTADGFQAFASASLDIDLARGEVELLKVDLPDRDKARDLKLKYHDHEGHEQQLNLGRLSLHCSIKAWGYAGASLMLAGSLRLGPNKKSHDVLLDPSQPAARKPGTLNSTHVSQPQLAGRTGDMRVDDGLKGQFNLFAGVQAGIKLTGALNWAPPAALAALRTAPVAGVSGQAAPQASQWLNLARLGANLSVAAGLGAKGELSLSLQKQRLILTIKAAVIAGPGVDGVFSFEVGYAAVGQLINLFRRELRNNQYHRLDWVEEDAFGFMSQLNLLGGVGLDVGMIYMMGADVVLSLYEALTRGGKGGPIAHSIIEYENQEELKQWFVEAIPEALGPMLMTLISSPADFSVTDTMIVDGQPHSTIKKYTKTQCHLLQQQAIERILGWIVRQAQRTGTLPAAQRQFEEACTRMNRFGTKTPAAGQAYCESRLELDNFMAVSVLRLEDQRSDQMRSLYVSHVTTLGALQDGFCRRSSYYGRTYSPTGYAKYIGPVQ